MISKEEYKKTLVRMWDTARNNGFKGSYSCKGVHCDPKCCPVAPICSTKMIDYYEVIEFVEKWAKEHPIETNGSRFLKNYPKAVVYSCDDSSDDGFVYVRLDDDNRVKMPIVWWESEVDNANCD